MVRSYTRAKTLIAIILQFLALSTYSTKVFSADIASATLQFKPSEKEFIEPVLRKSFENVLYFYKKQYGITLTRPVQLIASQDPNFIAKARHKAHAGKLSFDPMKKRAKQLCKNANRVTASADSHAIRVCFKSPVKINRDWMNFNKDRLSTVLAHEVMHTIQRQLSGSNYYIVGKRAVHGPKWLVEGTAVFAQNQFQNKGNWSKSELHKVFKNAQKSQRKLSEIVETDTHITYADYELSHFATFLLTHKFGQDKVLEYWKNLKSGEGWEIVFKKTFGLNMNAFMRDVERLRLNEPDALAWME